MLSLYRLLLTRIKVVLLADAGLEVEADAVEQHAERKARLLRLANDYEQEGLTEIAEEVRASSHSLRSEQPLSRSLPVATHLLESPAGSAGGQGKLPNLQQGEASGDREQAGREPSEVTPEPQADQPDVKTSKTRAGKRPAKQSKKE